MSDLFGSGDRSYSPFPLFPSRRSSIESLPSNISTNSDLFTEIQTTSTHSEYFTFDNNSTTSHTYNNSSITDNTKDNEQNSHDFNINASISIDTLHTTPIYSPYFGPILSKNDTDIHKQPYTEFFTN